MNNVKIAIISDLHGNLEATKKVFEDIKKRNVDKVICLGDIIAKGTHSNECIKLVKENCFVVLSGNNDVHFSKEHFDLSVFCELEQKKIRWYSSLLTQENKEYLLNLPFSYEFYLSGSLIRLFHATPEKNDVPILNSDTVATKSKMFEPSINTVSQKNADIVLYGHIHHQYLDKLYNKTLVNVGSVGNSYDVIRLDGFDSDKSGTICAHYVILEGAYESHSYEDGINIQLIRVPYDISKELEDIDNNLEPETYLHEIKNGLYRDMTKIEKGFIDRGVILRK